MAIKNSLQVAINDFLKGSNLRSYMDKRVIGGAKRYFETVAKGSSEVVSFDLGRESLNKSINSMGQTKVESVLKKYKSCQGTEGQMRFISSVVMTVVISHLKIHELACFLGKSSRDDLGLTDTFLIKLQSSVDMIDDVEGNFDAYLKEVSKGDIRYIEVGLKRLLATEVDTIV